MKNTLKNPFKFYYVRRDGKKGRAGHGGVLTVISKVEGEEVKFGLAFCSPNDNFEKAKGREIAIGQLETHPVPTSFTGNSANDLVRVWKDHDSWGLNRIKNGKTVSIIPQIWRGSRMVNIEQTGLTVLSKV